MKSPFWITEMYGIGYWIKKYGYYPISLPLFVYHDHGAENNDFIPLHEINNNAPLIFKFAPRLVLEYKKESKKPAYCLLNPFVFCRQKLRITKEINAKGTLFFPSHSTPAVENRQNWDKLIADFEKIPKHFWPIDICMHHTDIEKGLDKIFINKGFPVFNAGNTNSIEFTSNFYNILKNYQFSMSNHIGSYTFYSVEMDIPFSLFGEPPDYFNFYDLNLDPGVCNRYKKQDAYKKLVSLFTGFHITVSPEQKNFIDLNLGKNNTVSRIKAMYLLYSALVLYLMKYPGNIKLILKDYFYSRNNQH